MHIVGTIWYNRHKDSQIEFSAFKIKILSHYNLLSMFVKEKMKHHFTEQYCSLARTLAQMN